MTLKNEATASWGRRRKRSLKIWPPYHAGIQNCRRPVY